MTYKHKASYSSSPPYRLLVRVCCSDFFCRFLSQVSFHWCMSLLISSVGTCAVVTSFVGFFASLFSLTYVSFHRCMSLLISFVGTCAVVSVGFLSQVSFRWCTSLLSVGVRCVSARSHVLTYFHVVTSFVSIVCLFSLMHVSCVSGCVGVRCS